MVCAVLSCAADLAAKRQREADAAPDPHQPRCKQQYSRQHGSKSAPQQAQQEQQFGLGALQSQQVTTADDDGSLCAHLTRSQLVAACRAAHLCAKGTKKALAVRLIRYADVSAAEVSAAQAARAAAAEQGVQLGEGGISLELLVEPLYQYAHMTVCQLRQLAEQHSLLGCAHTRLQRAQLAEVLYSNNVQPSEAGCPSAALIADAAKASAVAASAAFAAAAAVGSQEPMPAAAEAAAAGTSTAVALGSAALLKGATQASPGSLLHEQTPLPTASTHCGSVSHAPVQRGTINAAADTAGEQRPCLTDPSVSSSHAGSADARRKRSRQQQRAQQVSSDGSVELWGGLNKRVCTPARTGNAVVTPNGAPAATDEAVEAVQLSQPPKEQPRSESASLRASAFRLASQQVVENGGCEAADLSACQPDAHAGALADCLRLHLPDPAAAAWQFVGELVQQLCPDTPSDSMPEVHHQQQQGKHMVDL